jgi:putative hydrolase of the HAD superfamily
MIRAIFFDAAGTLVHLRGSVGEHYAAVGRQLGYELSPDELDRAFYQAWKQAPAREAIDGARADDDKPWWRDLVDAVLAQLTNVPPDFERERFFESAYAHFSQPGVWMLYPEVQEVLALLAPRYQLAVVSNFDRRLKLILQNLGIASCFRHIFLSSELGADKPDPEIFRRALVHSGVHAGQALHVGDDRQRDWAAARAAGLRVFKLDRARNSLRDLLPCLEEWVGWDSNPQPTP